MKPASNELPPKQSIQRCRRMRKLRRRKETENANDETTHDDSVPPDAAAAEGNDDDADAPSSFQDEDEQASVASEAPAFSNSVSLNAGNDADAEGKEPLASRWIRHSKSLNKTPTHRTTSLEPPLGVLDVKLQWQNRRDGMIPQPNEALPDASDANEMIDESLSADATTDLEEQPENQPILEVAPRTGRNNRAGMLFPGAFPVAGPRFARENSQGQWEVEDEGAREETGEEAVPAGLNASAWQREDPIHATLVRELIATQVVNEGNRKRMVAIFNVAAASCACFVVAGVIIAVQLMLRDSSSEGPNSALPNPGDVFVDDAGPSFFRKATQCFDSREQLKETLQHYLNLQERLNGDETEEKDLNERASMANTFGWPIGEWCTSKITSFERLFPITLLNDSYVAQLIDFNEDISRWDVSGVRTFWRAFEGLKSFNQPLNSWNVSSATSLTYMFSDCFNFNQPLLDWNVSRATNFCGTFTNAMTFNQDLSNWDVSSAVNMSEMFLGCSEFNQPLNRWNVAKVKTFKEIFFMAPMFNSDLSSWDVSRATTMTSTFADCAEFNQPLSDWNVSKVTDFTSMFTGAHGFNQNLSTWDLSSAKSLANMFAFAFAFNGDVSPWNVSRVTDMVRCFCATNGVFPHPDLPAAVQSTMFLEANYFNQDVSRWNVHLVESFQATFSSSALNQSLSSWKTSSCTNMNFMFFRSTFNSDISDWDTSSVINMEGMFGNTTLFNSNISRWDTSSVVSMKRMFNGAEQFNIDISSWNVSRVVNFDMAFLGARNFSQNLCLWGPMLHHSDGESVSQMFEASACKVTDEPLLNDSAPLSPLCFTCGD